MPRSIPQYIKDAILELLPPFRVPVPRDAGREQLTLQRQREEYVADREQITARSRSRFCSLIEERRQSCPLLAMIESINVLDVSVYEQSQQTIELEYEFTDRDDQKAQPAGKAEAVRIKSLNLYPRFAQRLDQVYQVWPELGRQIASCLLSFAEGMVSIYVDIAEKRIRLPVSGQYRYRRAIRHMIRKHDRLSAVDVAYWFHAYLHPSYDTNRHTRAFFADFSNPFIRLSLRGVLHVVKTNEEFVHRAARCSETNSP